MGILDETRFVERLQFFDGQRLFASDLQGIEAFHREMRWLHNRSLHQPGIGNGFAVSGKRDDREVRVGPGYAIDAMGREIVLTRELVEPVPPVSGEAEGQSVFFDLVVSYPADSSLEEAETRQGICGPRGVVRLREQPVLCWVRLKDANGNLQPADPRLGQEVLNGLRIVLTRVEVIDCRLRQTISLAERRSARPSCRPYIACGTDDTEPEVDEILESFHYRLRWHVKTASAGFLATPCYSVRLSGQRVDPNEFYILDGAPQILKPEAASFDVEAVARFNLLGSARPADIFRNWRVVWMGVE